MMKLLLAGLFVAASVAAVSAPASAAPARSGGTQVTAGFETVAYHRHHRRHKVCFVRHHHRVCRWR